VTLLVPSLEKIMSLKHNWAWSSSQLVKKGAICNDYKTSCNSFTRKLKL
jgi:hypothetical protein